MEKKYGGVIGLQSRNDLPTHAERQLIQILRENKLPFIYTGDGTYPIGGKAPDFVHSGDKKLLIELDAKESKFAEKRRLYNRLGWRMLRISPYELKAPIKVARKIALFMVNHQVTVMARTV